MNILHTPEELATLGSPIVLAAGVFDGVHLGHAKVIETARQVSTKITGATPVVMSFSQHPAQVLRPDRAPKMLYGKHLKNRYLADLGIHTLLELPFTREFAELSALDFLKLLCTEKSQVAAICIGSDWTFGKARSGTLQTLREHAESFNFQVHEVPAATLDNKIISSTRIRSALSQGDIDEAKNCLGRPYSIFGKVIHGRGIGKKLHFPTANIQPDIEIFLKNGVYAGYVINDEHAHPHPAVANIGLRPSIDDKTQTPTLEVHLLDYSGDLYEKNFEIRFIARLRDEKKFASLDNLRTAITQDIQQAHKLLST
ncbi:MAG: bifunctional riboflavin kinase/FAD synthetase [Chthoniobacterales bacterium]